MVPRSSVRLMALGVGCLPRRATETLCTHESSRVLAQAASSARNDTRKAQEMYAYVGTNVKIHF
jgi:hypothetical protein